jgi:DNA-binding MarR family transcriptional regulator
MDSFVSKKAPLPEAARHKTSAAGADPAPIFELIELMFFAYRDFVQDADRLLEAYGFGRAHHRVLHFVSRKPGLTIAELLDILKITKQSLNRVLKELLGKGYVEMSMGVNDRRQRLLYPTARGNDLALEIARLQSRRFSRVLDQLPQGARAAAFDFLLAMVDATERGKVANFIASGAPSGASSTKPSATLKTKVKA